MQELMSVGDFFVLIFNVVLTCLAVGIALLIVLVTLVAVVVWIEGVAARLADRRARK